MEIIIIANSPGEISGWATPVVCKIKEKSASTNITIMLLPCPFASGREIEVARSITGVDRVLAVKETLSIIFSKSFYKFEDPLRILHIGGDPFFSVLLSRRLKALMWSYMWAQKKWDGFFTGYFARDEKNLKYLLKRKIPSCKIQVVGDLLVDSVLLRSSLSTPIEKSCSLTITLMPGSRLKEVKGLIPLFAGTCEIINREFPGTRFFIPISPYINMEELAEASPFLPEKDTPGVKVLYKQSCFFTQDGVEIIATGESIPAMAVADFIITIPGTTTAEAGVLGTPFYCILPMNRPEIIPYVGIVGLTQYIPIIGKPIKRFLMEYLKDRVGLLALPNQLAEKEIIPESKEIVDPEKLYQRVFPYLKDPAKRDKIRNDLADLYQLYQGAAEAVAETILTYQLG